jgi:hypothetical protein
MRKAILNYILLSPLERKRLSLEGLEPLLEVQTPIQVRPCEGLTPSTLQAQCLPSVLLHIS